MEYNDLIPEFIVADVERARHFYMDLLGFKLEYERPLEVRQFRVNDGFVSLKEFFVLDPDGCL
ncbi:TPA: VOC family protein [Streptococcus suis]|nr:VOC family protein [Streptococcus suis]